MRASCDLCYTKIVGAMIVQCAAALVSFTGLYGVLKKRPWGPFLCGSASLFWFCIAISSAMYPWGAVELAYALTNFGISRVWATEKPKDLPPWPIPCNPGCHRSELPPPVPRCVCDYRDREPER